MITPRRSFLRGAALTGASALAGGIARAGKPPRSARTISIFHTTDLHGHIRPTRTYEGVGNVGGLARCAAQIRAWRKASPHSLLIDVGDVFQGTATGWMTGGRLMIDLFNALKYDAWVFGNHEFDWGPEVVLDAVTRSEMPVLAGNMVLDGKPAGTFQDSLHPLSRVLPHFVKEVGGFRIGLIGLITPGLPYWLRPELLDGFDVIDPVESFKASLRFLREEAKVDAVVACGHMGWRERDDYANPVGELLGVKNGPEIYIGGHTHRDHPAREVGKTLYTQAGYFGIHCGRVDLTFDLESRKLLESRAHTVLMDDRVAEDPLVLDVAGKDLGEADRYLAKEIGELAVDLPGEAEPGAASPLHGLLGAAFRFAVAKEGIEPDGVLHGTFQTDTLPAGPMTVADAWEILPYENQLVAIYLTREELTGVLNEALATGSNHALVGFQVELGASEPGRFGRGTKPFVRHLRPFGDAEPAPPGHRFCILCNSFDVQSGGKRFMRLRALAARPECKTRLLSRTCRQALIDFFADRETIKPADLLTASPVRLDPAKSPVAVPSGR